MIHITTVYKTQQGQQAPAVHHSETKGTLKDLFCIANEFNALICGSSARPYIIIENDNYTECYQLIENNNQ